MNRNSLHCLVAALISAGTLAHLELAKVLLRTLRGPYALKLERRLAYAIKRR
jgi:hypothetical protein